MQLDRLLQSQGFGTRKECRSIIRHGLLKIDEVVRDDPFSDWPMAPGSPFEVDGDLWTYQPSAYVLMNKPAGYECSRKPLHHPSVLSLLPPPLRTRDVQPIGRLDEDTTGLLLLTDDGRFNHVLSSPKRKLAKVYRVECKHALDDVQLTALRTGVQLHDEPAPLAALAAEAIAPNTLRLTIGEGKYHQVKRMVAAAGNRVESLTRIAVGPLALPDDLPVGRWRWLTQEELTAFGFGA
jgi:16S rRNA pseudouridine516 synthase